jgi:hypothetical protein
MLSVIMKKKLLKSDRLSNECRRLSEEQRIRLKIIVVLSDTEMTGWSQIIGNEFNQSLFCIFKPFRSRSMYRCYKMPTLVRF